MPKVGDPILEKSFL